MFVWIAMTALWPGAMLCTVALNTPEVDALLSDGSNSGVRGLVFNAAAWCTLGCMVALISSDIYVSNDHMSVPRSHDNAESNSTYYMAVQQRRSAWRKVARAVSTLSRLNASLRLAAGLGGARPVVHGDDPTPVVKPKASSAAAGSAADAKQVVSQPPLPGTSPGPQHGVGEGSVGDEMVDEPATPGCCERCMTRARNSVCWRRTRLVASKLYRYCNPPGLPPMYIPIVVVHRVFEIAARVALIGIFASVVSGTTFMVALGAATVLHAVLVWHLNLSPTALCGTRLRHWRWRWRCITGWICCTLCCGRPTRPAVDDVLPRCCSLCREPDADLRREGWVNALKSVFLAPVRLLLLLQFSNMAYPGLRITWPALVRACYASESLGVVSFVCVRMAEIVGVVVVTALERGTDHSSVTGLGLLAAMSLLGVVGFTQVSVELKSERVAVHVSSSENEPQAAGRPPAS